MKTAEQILLDAAALIRKGWTKGAYARDATGQWVESIKSTAVCWCAEGAIYRASPRGAVTVCQEAQARFSALFPNNGVGRHGEEVRGSVYFNDYVAKDAEEVAQALERAARS